MKRLFLSLLICSSLLPAQRPERVIALEGETHHVQGIALVGGRFLVTSVDRPGREGWLMEFDGDGKRVRDLKIHDGAMYHPGGFDADGESVWIPVAEYRPKSRSVIQRRSAASFEVMSSFAVPDHIGAVAVGGDRLYLANWDARTIYEYSFDGRLIRARANPTAYRFQDLKMRDGVLAGAAPAGDGEKGGGAVVWMDPETLAVTGVRPVGRTDRGTPLVQEGIELRDGRVYLLPEDTPSRVFVYGLLEFTAVP
ncbi:MAG: hypothetical protein C0504_17395 [Candidatus Solibacter sp.]|nr:hypothetical protein [Candidatus Solibacter sp.]